MEWDEKINEIIPSSDTGDHSKAKATIVILQDIIAFFFNLTLNLQGSYTSSP